MRTDDRGAVLPLVAVSVTLLILMTSFTLDLGRLSLRRRDLQAVADVVSLDLVRLVDGRSAAEIQADPAWAAAIAASRNRNGFAASGNRTLQAQLGCYDVTTQVLDQSCSVPDAVRVVAGDTVPFYFQAGQRTTNRSAVAQRGNIASFEMGSALARLDSSKSTLLNTILSDLLGANINLGLVGYDGLVNADVSLLDLAAAGGFGTVDELLDANLTSAQFGAIAAQALTNEGDATNATIFGQQFANVPNDKTFQLRDFVTVGPGDPDAAEQAEVNLFQLLFTGAMIATGDNFLDLTNGIMVSLPVGLSNLHVTMDYRVIENPVTYIGPVSAAVPDAQTAQIHMALNISMDAVNLSGTSGAIKVPVGIDGASAAGDLIRIDCNDPELTSLFDINVFLDPLTGSIKADGTNGSPYFADLTLGGVPAVRLTVSNVVFNPAPPAATTLFDMFIGETRSTAGNNLNLGGILNAGNVGVQVLGLTTPATGDAIRDAVVGAVNSALTTINDAIQPALNTLGIETANADTSNLDIECGNPSLTG